MQVEDIPLDDQNTSDFIDHQPVNELTSTDYVPASRDYIGHTSRDFNPEFVLQHTEEEEPDSMLPFLKRPVNIPADIYKQPKNSDNILEELILNNEMLKREVEDLRMLLDLSQKESRFYKEEYERVMSDYLDLKDQKQQQRAIDDALLEENEEADMPSLGLPTLGLPLLDLPPLETPEFDFHQFDIKHSSLLNHVND